MCWSKYYIKNTFLILTNISVILHKGYVYIDLHIKLKVKLQVLSLSLSLSAQWHHQHGNVIFNTP